MQSIDVSEDQLQQKERIITLSELVSGIWNLGVITFGGPMSHIGVLKQVFIQKLKCIDEDRFTQLLTICQSLPGPTSTQLLISLSIYATASLVGGLLSFLIFSLPTFIVMFIAGMYLSQVSVNATVGNILRGFRVVSVAIILQAFWGLSTKYRVNNASVFLFIFSALSYRMFQSTYTIILLFILGGLYSLIFPFGENSAHEQNKRQMAAHSQSRFSNCFFGVKNIVILSLLLVLSIIVGDRFLSNSIVQTLCVFYRIGMIAIGGGHVILPMMSEFSAHHYFSEEAYWNGFSVISCMPGPMFNLSVYIGTLITPNILGALSAFIGLYIPCFLYILYILPQWQTYRSKRRIKQLINGMCCVSVGLILTAGIILWQNSCWVPEENLRTYLLSLIVLVCFVLLEIRKWNIVLVLGFGETLFIILLVLF